MEEDRAAEFGDFDLSGFDHKSVSHEESESDDEGGSDDEDRFRSRTVHIPPCLRELNEDMFGDILSELDSNCQQQVERILRDTERLVAGAEQLDRLRPKAASLLRKADKRHLLKPPSLFLDWSIRCPIITDEADTSDGSVSRSMEPGGRVGATTGSDEQASTRAALDSEVHHNRGSIARETVETEAPVKVGQEAEAPLMEVDQENMEIINFNAAHLVGCSVSFHRWICGEWQPRGDKVLKFSGRTRREFEVLKLLVERSYGPFYVHKEDCFKTVIRLLEVANEYEFKECVLECLDVLHDREMESDCAEEIFQVHHALFEHLRDGVPQYENKIEQIFVNAGRALYQRWKACPRGDRERAFQNLSALGHKYLGFYK